MYLLQQRRIVKSSTQTSSIIAWRSLPKKAYAATGKIQNRQIPDANLGAAAHDSNPRRYWDGAQAIGRGSLLFGPQAALHFARPVRKTPDRPDPTLGQSGTQAAVHTATHEFCLSLQGPPGSSIR